MPLIKAASCYPGPVRRASSPSKMWTNRWPVISTSSVRGSPARICPVLGRIQAAFCLSSGFRQRKAIGQYAPRSMCISLTILGTVSLLIDAFSYLEFFHARPDLGYGGSPPSLAGLHVARASWYFPKIRGSRGMMCLL
jgi:hypothetical protein